MYRTGEKDQLMLLPPSFDDLVGDNDPARIYSAFIDQLDLNELGINLNPDKVGNPEFHPSLMLKLLVYGYSYGIRSSRKLERAVHHNISFIYLMGGLKPDFKTIARFRKNNLKALRKLLRLCARLCVDMGLIEGNTLFVDGTKIRANAGIKNTWTEKRCREALQKVDRKIETLLAECDVADEAEEGQGSFVYTEALKDQKDIKEKIDAIMKKLEVESKKSVNTTDPDCAKVKTGSGVHAGYNMQSVVDGKHGLIVHNDVVSESNDSNQFSRQIDQAQQVLEKKCEAACADTGYFDTDDLKKIHDQNIRVVVPSKKQLKRKEPRSFDKSTFQYDSKNDTYRCPEGHLLMFIGMEPNKNLRDYRITQASLCLSCPHYGTCTTSRRGRRIKRHPHEDVREKIEHQYQDPISQSIYKLRKEKAELPFGHIKRNLKFDAFLVRGKKGSQAEGSLLSTCFNLARMMTIVGIPELLGKLRVMQAS